MNNRNIALAAGVLMAIIPGRAQDIDEYEKAFRQFHKCFMELSIPTSHTKTYHLSTGKSIDVLSRNDYERSAFVSADKTLEDIHLWKNSPYLWEQRHRKDNMALMDKRDLTTWEVENFGQISESYFTGSNSTFHLAAHGLLDPNNAGSSGKIMIGGQELDAKETAELIKKAIDESKDGFEYVINGLEQKFVVVLHCCNMAAGENSFAKQLSEELGEYLDDVCVVGAPDLVVCSMDWDKKEYTECVASDWEMRRAGTKGKIEYKQNWRVFKNGQDTGVGDKDYKTSVSNAQGLK